MQQVKSDQAPSAVALLSQAVVSNGLVFVSGQVHARPDNSLVEGPVADRLGQIFTNISALLEASGSSVDHVVKATVYVTDMSTMPDLNAAWASHFTGPLPAREAVCVKDLPLGASIEVSVIAET